MTDAVAAARTTVLILLAACFWPYPTAADGSPAG